MYKTQCPMLQTYYEAEMTLPPGRTDKLTGQLNYN